MHVRVRFAGRPDTIVVVESKLSTIDKFRKVIKDKFDVKPSLQRLLYGGKLLENSYTFHDYGIKLNDVIQLMVKIEPSFELAEKKDVKSKEKKNVKKEVDYVDTKSNLYKIGELVDMKDEEHGAWFEGRIVRIVKDPEYQHDDLNNSDDEPKCLGFLDNGSEAGADENSNNCQVMNGDICKLSPKSEVKGNNCDNIKNKGEESNGKSEEPKNECEKPKDKCEEPKDKCEEPKGKCEESPSQTTPTRKRGITDYFSKVPKKMKLNEDFKVHKKEIKVVNLDTDLGLLYKVKLLDEEDCETAGYYVGLKNIRPRARNEINCEDILIGDTYMVNYNVEEPHEIGYWYDFKLSEIITNRKTYDLIGTIYLGTESVPQDDTKVRVRDKIFNIETVVPISKRSKQDELNMTMDVEKRSAPLKCTKCRDNFEEPCKYCGCYSCSGKQKPEEIILCDECDHGYHMYCLFPRLSSLPDEEWYCPDCKRDPNEVVAPGGQKQRAKEVVGKGKRDWGRGMACVGKTQTSSMPANHFGPIPGIEVGMTWRFRIQLSETGVHRPPVSGIHGKETDGAYSIVLSGGYEDDVDEGFEFTYTGSGGRDLSGNKRTAEQSCDQTLTRENKGLARNCYAGEVKDTGGDAGENWQKGKPVRVVRSYKMIKHFPKYAPKEGIRYDGIYKVVKYYPEKGKSGFIVWKYLLRRDDPTPAPWEENGKTYEIIYPDGYLEAEAEKKALKEKEQSKKSKKRVLKEHNSSDDEELPGKKRRRKNGSEDTPLTPKSKAATPPIKSPISINPFTLAQRKTPNSDGKIRKKSEEICSKSEMEAIGKDCANKKMWEECLEVAKNGNRQHFINEITKLFLCIICQEVAANPVTTKCQHNFCMSCITLAFKSTKSETCAYCRKDLSNDLIEVNEELRNALRLIMPGYDVGKK